MNRDDQTPPEAEYDDLPDEAEYPPQRYSVFGVDESFPMSDDLDIDAALAAVSSLSDVLAEHEADVYTDDIDGEPPPEVSVQTAQPLLSRAFSRPPIARMQRGQLASVIPALLLMATGGYLTFALTLSQTPPAGRVVVVMVCGVIGMTLLSYWLTSGRWARGALFAGLTLLFVGGAWFYLTQPQPLSEGWVLLPAALGLAGVLSGLLAKPVSGRVIALSLGLLLGAGFILAAARGLIDPTLLRLVGSAWVVVLPLFAIFILLSLVFRRRAA